MRRYAGVQAAASKTGFERFTIAHQVAQPAAAAADDEPAAAAAAPPVARHAYLYRSRQEGGGGGGQVEPWMHELFDKIPGRSVCVQRGGEEAVRRGGGLAAALPCGLVRCLVCGALCRSMPAVSARASARSDGARGVGLHCGSRGLRHRAACRRLRLGQVGVFEPLFPEA